MCPWCEFAIWSDQELMTYNGQTLHYECAHELSQSFQEANTQ